MTYTCKICGTTSDASDFYSGMTSRCKDCHKAKVRENRKEKADYYRDYDAKRFREDPKVRARHRRYRKTEAGKASTKASNDRWKLANADKRAAHVLLGNAVKSGRAIKPTSCSACAVSGVRIEGHHEDYTKPLDVVWLCRQCHTDIHKGPQ